MSRPLYVCAAPTMSADAASHAAKSIPQNLVQAGRVQFWDFSGHTARELNEKLLKCASQDSQARFLVIFEDFTFRADALSQLVSLPEEIFPSVTYFNSADIVRPDFSPERLRSQDYLGAALLISGTAFEGIGGFAENMNVFLKLDFVLRATRGQQLVERGEMVLGEELATARRPSSIDWEPELRALLSEHLSKTHGGGEILDCVSCTLYPTRRTVQGSPLISIVIPSQGLWIDEERTQSHLMHAIQSIVERTTYSYYEVVVVLDTGADDDLVAQLNEILGQKLTVVWWDKPFNFSQKINSGVVNSVGDFVLLLNDDVEVISADWLERMLALAQLPGAGMVGSMLYFADDTIQHAGHAYHRGSPTHIGLGASRGSYGPLNGYLVEREVSGVTAACALIPREVFLKVGGMSALFPGNFNDVDLAMKITTAGYVSYWTPFAELYHFESQTRDAQVSLSELDALRHRWQDRLDDGRFWPHHPHELK